MPAAGDAPARLEQGDGVRRDGTRDEVEGGDLPDRSVERLGRARQGREDEQVPHLDAPEREQQRQRERDDEQPDARGPHQRASADPVGHDPRDRRHPDPGRRPDQVDRSERRARSGQVVDEPAEVDLLDPLRRVRERGTDQEQAEAGLAQGRERAEVRGGLRRRFGRQRGSGRTCA